MFWHDDIVFGLDMSRDPGEQAPLDLNGFTFGVGRFFLGALASRRHFRRNRRNAGNWAPKAAVHSDRRLFAELVEEIEAEARADRESRGVEPLGVEAILRQDPHTRPNQTKKSPAPAFHAATKAARQTFWESYSAFVAAFREAAEKLKAGDRMARFPLGSFPPALPFVSAYPSLPP